MNISNNEWCFMEALWKEHPLTLKQLCDTVGAENGWTKHNVIGTLKRMEAKELICVEQTAERKYFSPIIAESDARRHETEQLAEKAYGGSKLLLISSMVQNDDFTDEEIAELMDILNRKRR